VWQLLVLFMESGNFLHLLAETDEVMVLTDCRDFQLPK
jgi:uncharacterized protein YcgI (DUF1989 family)